MIETLRRTLACRSRLRGVGYRIRHAGKSPVQRAIEWIKNHRIPGQGIPTTHRSRVPYPEVTGYLIPTLYDFGEKELAREFARWLASVQRPDGGLPGPGTDVPYTFDTAQGIRGLLTVLEDLPELEGPLRRACDYVDSHIAADGQVRHDCYDLWTLSDGTELSQDLTLYALPPMQEAGRRLAQPRYGAAARRGMDYFRRRKDLTHWKPQFAWFSHCWGYMMEALVDLGAEDLARQGLAQAAALQRRDGAIPAYPGTDWVCSTGVAQLAVAWYKLGQREPADKAVDYLLRIQAANGGFYGSYGKGAQYLPRDQIAWATKFFLDACQWRTRADADHYADTWMESIDETDGRVQTILSFLGNLNGHSVLDLGCGKGRYIRVLKEKFPGASFFGLDLSAKMLAACPKDIQTRCGTLLNVGYPDASFDCVYTVEALEHALLVPNALREMARILKPGGKLLIIDKSFHKLGALQIRPWEQWFKPRKLLDLLQTCGVPARCRPIAYGPHTQPDGLFFAWEGVKRA